VLQLGVADKALRFGPAVILAPVAPLLELVGRLAAAHGTSRFRQTMLLAPIPTLVIVLRFGLWADGGIARLVTGKSQADRPNEGQGDPSNPLGSSHRSSPLEKRRRLRALASAGSTPLPRCWLSAAACAGRRCLSRQSLRRAAGRR